MTLLRRFANIILLGFAILAATDASAALPPTKEDSAHGGVLVVRRANDFDYDHVFIYKSFRIFYTHDGKPTSPNDLSDADNNGVPDYIEAIANKLWIAKTLFTDVAHLKDPLKEGLFHERGAEYIDVYIKDIAKQNGIASDRVQYNMSRLLDETPFQGKSASIKLHRALGPNTMTPMHELFHLFQFNYSMFYNPWLMEGLGRWSQNIILEKQLQETKLPSTGSELDELLAKKHEAEFFWNRLSSLCDEKIAASALSTTTNETSNRYRVRPGVLLIKKLLENTEKQYSLAKTTPEWANLDDGVQPDTKRTKSAANNKYILAALRDAISESCHTNNQELIDFNKLLSHY